MSDNTSGDMGNASAATDKVLGAISFNADGLVPVIAQQFDSGEVLMMAWMNRDAIAETLKTGQVCYFSRWYFVLFGP